MANQERAQGATRPSMTRRDFLRRTGWGSCRCDRPPPRPASPPGAGTPAVALSVLDNRQRCPSNLGGSDAGFRYGSRPDSIHA